MIVSRNHRPLQVARVTVEMNDSSELSRAERLKLWQALKNTKKRNDKPIAEDRRSSSQSVPKKEKRRKYVNILKPSDLLDKSRPSTVPDSLSTRLKCENSNPNNDFEKAAASLHQKFRDVRLSDEFPDKCINVDSNRSIEHRSSILEGYHTADDKTPVPHGKKSPPITSDVVYELQAKLDCMDAENARMKLNVADANSVKREAVERLQMCVEEVQALTFHNDILTQRVDELESCQSRDRMHTHELESSKSQKHRREIKMLKEKNVEYETRANAMVAEMAEQMAQLQDMAMKRIEVRECTDYCNTYH